MTDREPDPELRQRLLAADPASSLPAAGPDRVGQLLEDLMSDTDTRTRESRETGTRDRSPLTWLVAAASVVLIAAAGAVGLAQRDNGSAPAARPSLTELRDSAVSGLCILPNARVLRVQSVAFRGTLVSLTDTAATFHADHWYAGGPTDSVKVAPSPDRIPEMMRASDLTVGDDYLVAATGGMVTGCGFTGPVSPRLQKLYDAAFG